MLGLVARRIRKAKVSEFVNNYFFYSSVSLQTLAYFRLEVCVDIGLSI